GFCFDDHLYAIRPTLSCRLESNIKRISLRHLSWLLLEDLKCTHCSHGRIQVVGINTCIAIDLFLGSGY
ncbi:hypothetical protein BCV72DRAFT_169999, partial [Rhizopus microsporus var. microsporus]